MRVYKDIDPIDFDSWCTDTLDTIKEHGKENEFNALCEELYPDGVGETEFNDFIRFEWEYIYECLGIKEDEEIEE